MKQHILLAFLIIGLLLVSGINGCVIEEKMECNKPYIKVVTGIIQTCCLDQNDNGICDTDEPEAKVEEKGEEKSELLKNSTWILNGGSFLGSGYYPHWNHMPLSYSIDSNCGDNERRRIIWAFNEIQNSTEGKVNFIEAEGYADIVIICYKEFPSSESIGTVESGLAEPLFIGDEIQSAKISFFNVDESSHRYPGGCIDYPDTEIHEILHTMGFGHKKGRLPPKPFVTDSIMDPVSSYCSSYIDQEIIDALKIIYS